MAVPMHQVNAATVMPGFRYAATPGNGYARTAGNGIAHAAPPGSMVGGMQVSRAILASNEHMTASDARYHHPAALANGVQQHQQHPIGPQIHASASPAHAHANGHVYAQPTYISVDAQGQRVMGYPGAALPFRAVSGPSPMLVHNQQQQHQRQQYVSTIPPTAAAAASSPVRGKLVNNGRPDPNAAVAPSTILRTASLARGVGYQSVSQGRPGQPDPISTTSAPTTAAGLGAQHPGLQRSGSHTIISQHGSPRLQQVQMQLSSSPPPQASSAPPATNSASASVSADGLASGTPRMAHNLLPTSASLTPRHGSLAINPQYTSPSHMSVSPAPSPRSAHPLDRAQTSTPRLQKIYSDPSDPHGMLSADRIQYTQLAAPSLPPGSGTMRLLHFGSALTKALAQPGLTALEAWAVDFFTSDATVNFRMTDNLMVPNGYELPVATLPKFYDALRNSGSRTFQLLLDAPVETKITTTTNGAPSGAQQLVQCDDFTWMVGYDSGSTVLSTGALRALFEAVDATGGAYAAVDPCTCKIKRMEWTFQGHEEFVNRASIVRRHLLDPSPLSTPATGLRTPLLSSGDKGSPMKLDHSESETERPNKRARTDAGLDVPRLKEILPKANRKRNKGTVSPVEREYEEVRLPPPVCASGGCFNPEALRILETASLMSHLCEVLLFSQNQPNVAGPIEALSQYAELCNRLQPIKEEVFIESPLDMCVPTEAADSKPYDQTEASIVKDASTGFRLNALDKLRQLSTTSIPAPPPSAPLPSSATFPPFMNGSSAHSVPASPIDTDNDLFRITRRPLTNSIGLGPSPKQQASRA